MLQPENHRKLNSLIILAMAMVIIYNMNRLDQALTHIKGMQVIALDLAELKDKEVCQEMLYTDVLETRHADSYGPRI